MDEVEYSESDEPHGNKKFHGFVPIPRSFFNGPLWSKKRIFSQPEAYIDLCQSARYSKEPAKKLIGSKMITWGRGQMPASIRFLATRWSWSSNKVRRFLDLLGSEKLITTDILQAQTIITVLDEKRIRWSDYNSIEERNHQNQVLEEEYDDVGYANEYAAEYSKKPDDGTAANTKQKERRKKEERKKKERTIKKYNMPILGLNTLNSSIPGSSIIKKRVKS